MIKQKPSVFFSGTQSIETMNKAYDKATAQGFTGTNFTQLVLFLSEKYLSDTPTVDVESQKKIDKLEADCHIMGRELSDEQLKNHQLEITLADRLEQIKTLTTQLKEKGVKVQAPVVEKPSEDNTFFIHKLS